MKRAAITAVVLALVTYALAQTPATQNPPATQTPAQTQPGQSQPATQGTAPAGAAQTPAPPAGKRPPQAKTQPEFDAYNAAIANRNDAAALEKASDDFAAKYPDSELTVLLYRADMHAYQTANNADKMLEMGRKVLKIDPDDPEALIGVAEVLTERTKETDLDKSQRLEESVKLANHALETIDTDIAVPYGTPQERIDAYKSFLRSSAYAVLGTQCFNLDNFKDAEKFFRKSIDAYPEQPDPVVMLRLAVALDKQEKYQDALQEANKVVALTQENTAAGTAARHERDRLVQLTGGQPAPAAQGPSPTPTPKN